LMAFTAKPVGQGDPLHAGGVGAVDPWILQLTEPQ